MDPCTRIEPRTKDQCDSLNCFYCRYCHKNQERQYCYKYELYHKLLNTLT